MEAYVNKATDKFAFTSQDDLIAAIKKDLNDAGDIKSVTIDGSGNITIEAFADLNDGLDMSLHVGADSTQDNKIGISISMMSARGLGVNGLDVSGDTDTNATNAIDTITDAIQKVSTQRSALGAVQNRLEHTINNLDNVVENTTSAESAIRDTDMATEMVKYSNNNILAQAGQAMLAQANQSNQGVLSLLG
jgi:flagellin